MDLYDEGFKLQDMIDSDMRSLRSELGDIFANELNGSPGLDSMSSGFAMDTLDSLDSELSNDGTTGWMNSSHMYNLSDFDSSLGGVLVNPQTALPVSMSESFMMTSPITVPSDLTESSSVSSSPNTNESPTLPTSTSITVTLPIQMISTSSLPVMSDMKEYSHVSLTLDVPSPSPATHILTSSQMQQTVGEADVNENNDSPRPKSKSKSSKSNHHLSNENSYPKPAYSYSCLIAMALKNSKTGSLPVNEIYDFMTENFPYFKTAPNGWKNSVRHNLSLNKCFEKIEKPSGNSAQRKGYLWAMNPAKVEKMEEELQKWGSKDPVAIRKSMANPERLELIEKGELKNSDFDSDVEINVSHIKAEVEEDDDEKPRATKANDAETEIKIQITSVQSDLLNSDFNSLSDSVAIDPCLPELDIQKGIWENLCEDRLQFINESPALSPKHENMDDDSSPESSPSSHSSYIHTNFIYKCAPRASPSTSSKRVLPRSSLTAGTDHGTICDA